VPWLCPDRRRFGIPRRGGCPTARASPKLLDVTGPSTTTRRNIADALWRLSKSTLDDAAFRQEAVAMLRRAVDFDAWCWALLDPVTRLPADALAENPVVSGKVGRFLRLVYQQGDAPNGVEPGTSVSAVYSLRHATGGDPSRSARWREVLGPGGYGDELVAGLVAGGLAWGHLSLYRDAGAASFSVDDRRFLAEVAPALADRLRRAARTLTPPGDMSGHDDPGTLLVGRDLSLLAATPAGLRWLDELKPAFPQVDGLLPPVVYALRARIGEGRQPSARAHVRSRGWWYVLTGSVPALARSIPAGTCVVTIRPASGAEAAELQMLAWGLSRREREVARSVMDGRGTEEIANRLVISEHTVRDHVRSMFDKLGVQSRRQLVAALAGLPK
jgi:DNA-binding CsgD family transcriptional regulator